MKEPLLDKLDRKIGRYAPKYLMTIFVIGTAIVWLLNYIVYARTGVMIYSYITFNKEAIISGQVWRLITFIFTTFDSNPLLLMISLYFYWLIGNALERTWGSFKFDVFYLSGILFAIASGFITGYATVEYLNLSLFLAFAILYPNHKVYLFFFIPVKMKWLAIFDLALIVLSLIFNDWPGRIAIFVALFNVILFMSSGLIRKWSAWRRKKKWQKGFYVVDAEEEKPSKKKREKAEKPHKEKRKKSDNDDPFEL